MRNLSFATMAGAIIAVAASSAAFAQQPNPAPGTQPDKPAGVFATSPTQRTYWPTTDYYDPSKMIGRYIYITKSGQMDFATTRVSTLRGPITTTFKNASPALTYDFKKSEDINVGIPGIASAKYGADEVMHLQLDDISETTIDGPGADFCTDWPRFKYIRMWDVGEKIIFVDHVLTSHAAYKTGKQQSAGAQIGIGSYFSANGGTAMATSTETNVPAMAVNGVPITLSIELIANGCPASRPHASATTANGGAGLGRIRTESVRLKAPVASF